MISRLKNLILDTLFPIACFSCGKSGELLCKNCFTKIILKTEQVCPLCEKRITPDGRVCFGCQGHSMLDALLTATTYGNEIIPPVVHNFKYRFMEGLHIPLGKILVKAFTNSQLSLPGLIIPVPLHRRRLRYRGFNQAELLAQYLGANLTPGFSIPIDNNLIVRQRYTSPQMKIKNYHQRKKNLENAFVINKDFKSKVSQLLEGKSLLLVDDIATTGATLFECAKVLKSAGAREVFAIVIARQEIEKK